MVIIAEYPGYMDDNFDVVAPNRRVRLLAGRVGRRDVHRHGGRPNEVRRDEGLSRGRPL